MDLYQVRGTGSFEPMEHSTVNMVELPDVFDLDENAQAVVLRIRSYISSEFSK